MNIPPLVCRAQLLADIHKDLAYCGHDKLLSNIYEWFWWPGMHEDVSDCVHCCEVLQKHRVPPPPLEELPWINKESAPFLGWSINATGPFPKDRDGNRFLLVSVDPFSKLVEADAVPLLHNWHAA